METLRTSQQTYARGLTHRVQSVRHVSPTAYVLRVDRKGLQFDPGQYINLGPHGSIAMREYSVYSGVDEEFLEILVKEVEGGVVSPALKRLEPGDPVALEGPFGFFVIEPEQREHGKFLFVASGTGISPFHCFAKSYPGLDYRVVHGVRTATELYDREVFDPGSFVSCISREEAGDFHGRVTDYLRAHPAAPDNLCYLCGNCDMIYEAFDILRSQGVPSDHLFAEVYF